MNPPSTTEPALRRGIRWWPAVVIVVLAAGRLIQTWHDPEQARQQQVMRTGGVTLVGLALLLLWILFFARLTWKVRRRFFAVAAGVVALAALLFRFVGVTGDLVPILEPRWRTRPTREVVHQPPASASRPAATASSGPDFPQFLGPRRDGVIDGVRLATNWVDHPPQLLWRQSLGSGWGGFAIVGDRALTQEQDGDHEVVSCVDLVTGRRLWEHRNAARYDNPIGGLGPRATPTVVSNRVYALGATGWLDCLALADGSVVWSTNVVNGRPATDLVWGLSSSPLVLSNRVIIAPLGRIPSASLLALDAGSGAVVWTGGDAEPHYSSPRLELVRGVPQLLTFTGHGAAGHDPGTGALLWEHPWRGGHPHVTDPRVVDEAPGRILVTSGYGTGAQLIEVAPDAQGKWSVTNIVWRSMRLKSKFAEVILRGGFAYGLDDGRLACLDLRDGTRRWDGERYGHGQLLLVGAHLLITAENGELALVDAEPDGFRERARFAALTGKTWNPPAMAGDILLVRNDREAAAFRLARQP